MTIEVLFMYYAIIGDIVHSKEIVHRIEFQNKLKCVLEQINSDYDEEIASNFVITLGDEFQGLLLNPRYILEIIERIKFETYPVKVRFGIGIGEIHTQINRSMAIGADGPAYHHARNMINELKAHEKGKMSTGANIKFGADEKSSLLDLVNANLWLCSFIESKWTEKQRELIKERFFSKKSQREIALRFNLSQSSIQRRFKSSGYYNYISALEVVQRILIKEWSV